MITLAIELEASVASSIHVDIPGILFFPALVLQPAILEEIVHCYNHLYFSEENIVYQAKKLHAIPQWIAFVFASRKSKPRFPFLSFIICFFFA